MTDSAALLVALLDDSDFQGLSRKQSGLNLFEALGVVRYEVRHSNFLSYLLDPARPHGLGDAYLRAFLKAASRHLPSGGRFHELRFRLLDLDQVEVRREWEYIDILIVDDTNHWCGVIENKIDSGEHSDQLARYLDRARDEFPGYDILPIYLTPDGDAASHQDYIAIGYDVVIEAIEDVLTDPALAVPSKLEYILSDYSNVLRSHIMQDQEVAELCRQIYRRHKEAIDLIMEHRPSHHDFLRAPLEALLSDIADEYGWIIDHHNKRILRFLPAALDRPAFNQAHGQWTKSGRTFLCELKMQGNAVTGYLWLGPGAPEFRERVYTWAKAQTDERVTRGLGPQLSPKWQQLYNVPLYSAKTYPILDEGDVGPAIQAIERTIRDTYAPGLREVVDLMTHSDWYHEAAEEDGA